MELDISYKLLVTAVLFCLSIRTADAVATCYLANSHQAADSIFVPCNSNQPFSMCYRTQNDSTIEAVPDIKCLPNGLAEGWNGIFWRESCTDPTWQSPYCLTAFSTCPSDSNGNTPVTPCDNDPASLTWCCGLDNTACCGTSGAIVIAAVLGPSNTTSSSSISSPTSTSSTISSSSPPSSHHALKASDIAGAAVVVAFLLLFVGSLLWAYIIRQRKRKQAERSREDIALANINVYPVGELEDQKVTNRQVSREIVEAGVYSERSELYGADGRYQNENVLRPPNEMYT